MFGKLFPFFLEFREFFKNSCSYGKKEVIFEILIKNGESKMVDKNFKNSCNFFTREFLQQPNVNAH